MEEHKHRFAAWAAGRATGRAASVNGCSFTVKLGKQLIEAANLNEVARSIECLPQPNNFDTKHREWRDSIIQAAKQHHSQITHGVAAKLINIYFKSIFVCSGNHEDPRVKAIHPPIDSLLLDALYKQNIGGRRNEWQSARRVRWSKFNSEEYESVISAIQQIVPVDNGLWTIEEYWQGFQ